MLIRYVINAVTLTFDPLTLNICSTSGVTWPKSVVCTKFERNIEQSRLSY